MAFDVEGAHKAGYTDAEIADHLAQSAKFDAAQARKAGYSDKELITHLAGAPAPVAAPEAPAAPAMPAKSGVLQGVQDLVGGAVRGAGSIGATILAPVDAAARALGFENEFIGRRDRREAMDAALSDLGADTDSLAFKAGKLGTEIAGTAAIPGVVARPLAGVVPRLSQAVATGGFRTGAPAATTVAAKASDLGTRVFGAGIAGAASAAAVDSNDAGAGAAVGAALPPALKLAGATGGAVGRTLRRAVTPTDVLAARTITDVAGMTPQQLRSTLAGQTGPSLVPGDLATVPQILQNMQVSQLARTVHNAGGMQMAEREGANALARVAALDRISPVSGTVQQAADNFGNALEAVARPAERAADAATSAAYGAIDPLGRTAIELPLAELRGVVDKYLGPGTFGKGFAARQGLNAAEEIGTQQSPAAETAARAVPYQQLDNLRKSLGDALRAAEKNEQSVDAGALRAMIAALDRKVEAVASGRGGAGEVFPADIADAWRKARELHQAQRQRFNQGPQGAMFRRGADGLPVAQGGDLAGRFMNATRGQTDDASALLRLTQGDRGVMDAARNFIATDAASKVNALGQLTSSKFANWRNARSGMLQTLLPSEDQALLGAIARNLERADSAQRLGMATGSNTTQNVQSALDLGLLDSPVVNVLASRVPLLGSVTGPALGALKESARKTKANALAELLADPLSLDDALARGEPLSALEKLVANAQRVSSPALYRAAPVLLTAP